ncbi:MAG: hypothetical protein M3P18_11185 [Actinomycetota bacterium]|nr:hypothetical protein [Actinomycetota bacterium]
MSRTRRLTRPRFIVELAIEELPAVRYIAANPDDEARLVRWFDSRPDLKNLVNELASYRDFKIEGTRGRRTLKKKAE